MSTRASNAVSLEKIIWKSLNVHPSNKILGTEKKNVIVHLPNSIQQKIVLFIASSLLLSSLLCEGTFGLSG